MTTKLRGGLDPRVFDRDGNLRWAVVAAIMSEHGDREYSAAQIRNIAWRAMKKLKQAFLDAENAETAVALLYISDLKGGYAAYRAWKCRIAPKQDSDYGGWEE